MILTRRSLQTKLVLAFVALGILPVAVLGWRTWRAQSAAAGQVGSDYATAAAVVADKIDRNLFERYGDVQAFGINAAVFDRHSWYQRGSDVNPIAAVQNNYARLYGFYVLSILVDRDGRVIAVNDHNPSGKPIETRWIYDKRYDTASWFRDALAGKFLASADGTTTGSVVQDAYFDDDVKRVYGDDGLVIGFSAPVMDPSGAVIGVWNNRARFSLVEEVFESAYRNLKSQRLDSAELTLIDRTGRVLVDFDPARDGVETVRRDPAVQLKLNLAEEGVDAAKRLVANESGFGRALHLRKQLWQTTGFAKSSGALGFPGLGWGVMVQVPESASLAQVQAFQRELLWTLLLSVCGLAGSAYALARSLSRPILARIAQLTDGAKEVASAAGQVSTSALSLSQGATEEAAALEETSASMEEMASMTRKNAENSQRAATHIVEVDARVQVSNHALSDMVVSMASVQESSRRVAKIIKTIDEIAFQTNILALNAAVEAARAGEAGMGFAVVADEVRNLAQRSAQAAKDTADLIETSIAMVQAGNQNVERVASAISDITESVSTVKGIVDEVSQASREQMQGFDQVAQAIIQMEKVTQTTAATAEESAAASEELNAQAETAMALALQFETLIAGHADAAPAARAQPDRAMRPPSGRVAKAASKGPRRQTDHQIPMGDTGTYGRF